MNAGQYGTALLASTGGAAADREFGAGMNRLLRCASRPAAAPAWPGPPDRCRSARRCECSWLFRHSGNTAARLAEAAARPLQATLSTPFPPWTAEEGERRLPQAGLLYF